MNPVSVMIDAIILFACRRRERILEILEKKRRGYATLPLVFRVKDLKYVHINEEENAEITALFCLFYFFYANLLA